jgi:hypothetical protein
MSRGAASVDESQTFGTYVWTELEPPGPTYADNNLQHKKARDDIGMGVDATPAQFVMGFPSL